jgi:hypothetical protein
MNETNGNNLAQMVTQAIDEMKAELGDCFDIEKINLAELQRRTSISRSKLRRLKRNGWKDLPHGNSGTHKKRNVLSEYTGTVDDLLRSNVTNSEVIYDKLVKLGYKGGRTSVKNYIAANRALIPAPRHTVSPQGNRGRRYTSEPGETYQMDWGFVNVETDQGDIYKCTCFAMICHHCGERYVEFFTNAKQENLFIGMIHAFIYMGVPETILTDNMKSVVVGRDENGFPIWQKDYAVFMDIVGFRTKLCRPRHPFTKGAVERLVRYVKQNFIQGRTFGNITDLNIDAVNWCNEQNNRYHKAVDCIPAAEHSAKCMKTAKEMIVTPEIRQYLAPVRKISFDGFANYEGRRFGVPYSYQKKICRVMRDGYYLHILDLDMTHEIVRHNVTWSRSDTFCEGQYCTIQPEEFPTAPVTVSMKQKTQALPENSSFDKFDFGKKVNWDD